MDSLERVRDEIKNIGMHNIQEAKDLGKKFFLGSIHISDGVMKKGYTLDSHVLSEQFEHYKNCDWGYGNEDSKINENHISIGYGDVLGIYEVDGDRIWIQTDLCENTVTTIYLPEEM